MKKATSDVSNSPEAMDARLEEIGKKLDRLRSLYESFFSGAERVAPATARRELNRLMLELQQFAFPKAAQRFRFQTLSQRWVLLTTYWNRTMREMETGTYRRDIEKAQRRLAERGGGLTEQDALAMGIPANRAKAFIARQNQLRANKGGGGGGAPTSPGTVSPPVPATASRAPIPGLSDGEVEEFFRNYAAAHVELGHPAPAFTIDQMKDRLAREVPKILAEHSCARVKLDVAVVAGKVRLRAHPLREDS